VPCCGDHRGAFVFAVGLAIGEESPVSAVVTVVNARRWGMTGGVTLSMTVSSKWDFSIFRNE